MDEANFIRALDSLGGGNLLRRFPSSSDGDEYGNRPNSARSIKRLNPLSGMSLGHQKRTFDEVDRTAFDGFNKRNFDEIDRVAFDGLAKRNVRSTSASSS